MSDNDELDAELLALADEDDSGEASAPGSPDSLGSGAMSESEDEGIAAEDDEGGLYPLDGVYRDEADKARILAMPEIQREQILADRAAESERAIQDRYLQIMFQKQEKEGKKRSADAADLDDGQRKSSRTKVKMNEPLETYKRQREQRGQELKRQRERKERRGRSRSPLSAKAGSEDDADGESEVEWDAGRKSAPKEDLPADIKDIQHALIKRENFAKVCFWPGFESAMVGCFARVSVGPGENGHNTYRIGQIKGFEEKHPYVVENEKGKPIMTDQYVVCKHGRDVKTVPFTHVSNSKLTDVEFERYKKVLATEDMRFPTKSFVQIKLNDISKLLNHQFTDEELNQKLKRQDKYAVELAKVTSAAPKQKSQAQIQAERLDALNRENRKRNNEEIRKALIAERKAERMSRAAAAAKQEKKVKEEREKAEKDASAKARLAVPGIDDLFDGSDISRTATPDGTKIPRTGTPSQKKERNVIPTFKKKTMDDDVIAAMDFGVEIDI